MFASRVPPQRIRTLLSLFAFALTLPLVALAAFAFRELALREEESVEDRVAQVAQLLAGDVDRELSRALVTLDTLATSPALEDDDLATFHDRARRVYSPDLAAILLIDTSMAQLLNTRAEFGTPLPPTSDPETAKRVIATKQRQVSDLFHGVVSKQYVINIEIPIIRNGAVRYVLIMAINTTRFADLLREQRLNDQWLNKISDNKGLILARSDAHETHVGQPVPSDIIARRRLSRGVIRSTDSTGAHVIQGTARSSIAGWTVTATVPASYAEDARRRGQFFSIALVTTAIALGLALAYVFGGLMTRPLQEATSAAANVGAGARVEALHSPLVEANALTQALSDASHELRRRQDHAQFLMRELAHRSKNQLAVVMGMAVQTARQCTTLPEFLKQFNQRIHGLAKSQDLMVARSWEGALLEDLVRAQLDLFGATSRADIRGNRIFLNANAVQNIGFALHELATNASKHGALATPGGRVHISWRGPEPDNRLHIEWVETGGPLVQQPERRGFGHTVITTLVAQALQGTASLDFDAEGIQWRLDIPGTFVLPEPSTKATTIT